MQPEDRLLAVNGDAIHNQDQAMQDIRANNEDQIHLTIERAGKRMDVTSNLDHVDDDQDRDNADDRLGGDEAQERGACDGEAGVGKSDREHEGSDCPCHGDAGG